MATSDYGDARRGGGAAWLYVPIVLILFLGGAMSVVAYVASEPELTVLESIAAGYAGLAALIVSLFAAALAVVVSLFGALLGIVAAGGAVAMALFIVGSPILAIILIVMLLRRQKTCPDPGAHE